MNIELRHCVRSSKWIPRKKTVKSSFCLYRSKIPFVTQTYLSLRNILLSCLKYKSTSYFLPSWTKSLNLSWRKRGVCAALQDRVRTEHPPRIKNVINLDLNAFLPPFYSILNLWYVKRETHLAKSSWGSSPVNSVRPESTGGLFEVFNSMQDGLK